MLHNGDRLVTCLRSGDRLITLLMHGDCQIYPAKKWSKTQLLIRIADDGQQKWYEVGLRLPCAVPGNAAEGWNLLGIPLRLQRSEDLVNWTTGEFVDCAGSPTTNGDGSKTYWARSIFPVDSKVKSGQLRAKSVASWGSGTPGDFGGDTRNNPITKLTVAGVNLALGGFPYALGTAGEDERMTADMQPFYSGATMVATSNVLWELIIPGVTNTTYGQLNKIWWEPGYYVADMFGDLTTLVNGYGLAGDFVNADGVRTAVQKQFFRY